DLALAHQERWAQQAEQIQPEQDYEHTADAPNPDLRLDQPHSQRGRRGAEGDEDERKPRDEPQRVHQGRATPDLEFLEREACQEPHIARDQGQNAGGEEAKEPGDERESERGRHPQKQTAETTVVQRPSSPHSAVEVMFIVRTISPDKSHCSRRSSQALSVSNGTPSTVASIDAARSSAYSPDVISFCP